MNTAKSHRRGTGTHLARVVSLLVGTVILAERNAVAASTHPTASTQAIAQTSRWPTPDPRIEDAWKQFEEIHGDNWKVTWNETTGLPSMIYGAKSTPYAGDAEQVARMFLAANPVLFGIDNPAMSLAFQGSRPLKSYQRVQFGLRYKQLDVIETRLVLLVDRSGSVVHVTNDPWPVRLGSVIPDIDADTARARVLTAVDGKILALDDPPQLVILPEGDGRLVYRALPRLENENIHYEVIVDANSGDVLRAHRLAQEYRAQPAHPAHLLQSQRVPIQPEKDSGAGQHGPASSPPLSGLGIDACDGEWQYSGPKGQTTVIPTTTSRREPSVRVTLGVGNINDSVTGVQTPAFYGAGLKLLPCKQYTIRFTANVSTWDTYNNLAGDTCVADFRDVFLVNMNSDDFLWNLLNGQPTGNLSCEDAFSETSEFPPGKTWQFGGAVVGQLCSLTKSVEFVYYEADETWPTYLTFGLDTSYSASVPNDDAAPSWGTLDVEILGETQIFDPNPYANGVFPPILGTDDDHNAQVPCDTYRTVTLSNFQMQPESDGYWYLSGEYVDIVEELEIPVDSRPQCRDSSFPFTRSCQGFEAVMCYYHLTETMKYVEGLGYKLRNKPIRVDPHGLNGVHNAHFSPVGCPYLDCGLSTCNGYLAFGEGGVDSAEDADVIFHEYGHALQDEQACGAYLQNGNPTGKSNESRSMGEGFADYWAFSNTTGLVTDAALVFEWFEPTDPRRLDGGVQYPTALAGEDHADGLIWGGTLWDLYNAVGNPIADDVILMSHSLVASNPTFRDGIRALIAADQALYGGAHAIAILQAGVNHGIIREVHVSAIVSGEPAPGVPIDLSPTDESGMQGGTTPFVCYYGHGAEARFTAPPASVGQSTFQGWSVSGQLATPAAEVAIIVNDSYPLKAHYAVQRNQPPPHGHHP